MREAFSLTYMNILPLKHIKPIPSSSLPSIPRTVLAPIQQNPQNSYYCPKKEWLVFFTSWRRHTRLPCLPDVLWSWLTLLHVLEEDTQLLQFRSEDLPAVWWLRFLIKFSGDSKRGSKFGRNFFSIESCWESWEWAPLWPLTGWCLYKVKIIPCFFPQRVFLSKPYK